MYKTKKEVDAHVRAALSKARTETERQLRSFTIAKLYYKISEFASAEQYLCSYLNVKEDNDQAHKLLGQCYQRLKKPDKALQSFQRSLQLNPKQPDVLTEVCQLLLDDKNLNVNKAKYWCDLAESEKVQHDAVFSLRLKLMNKDNLETNQVEEMIQKEISARPNDVQLRVRLIRNYIEQKKVLEAFKYIYNLEMTLNDNFANSSEWYNIVWLVLSKYEQLPNTKKDWEFWLLLVICLERQVYISFSLATGSATGGVTETANLLFNLDQYLFKITLLSDKLCAQRELVALFLDHYRGQMLLYAVSLIIKRELLQNKNKWKETVKAILPLLLLAFQIEAPENKEPWMKHCDEQGKQLIQLWNREGSFRCSQAGRTLLSCIVDETSDKENAALQMNNMLGNQPQLWTNCDELLAQVRQTCSDRQWRRSIFALLFCNSDQKVKEQSSLLIKSPKLAEPVFELPTYADVERYEEAAQYLKPQSLQHMVYLCLGNDNLSYVRAKYFSGLSFSTHNLSFCGAESLNQLDVDTFLYAATIQAKRSLQVEREAFDNYNSGNRSATGRPRILPFVNLQGQLCTEEQANWWLAAYRVYKNLSGDNLAELRANLQFGIEAVRGINGPKIDMVIVFKLGQIFVARSEDIVKPVEKAFLEARAESIYKYGLNMVKMNNRGVLEPFRKYFKYAKANTSAVEREVAKAAEGAVSYLAKRYFQKSQYEDLIEELAGIDLPFATYHQAEAYRKLDEANKTPKKAKRMYLDRAIECLNQTEMLLKNTETDPNHPLNSIIHTELKRLQQALVKFSNDTGNYASSVGAHNNSSTYEDAEADFYPDVASHNISVNRSRREAAVAGLIGSPRNTELENLVKQMATTLSFVKEELVDTIKPEMLSMRKEITSLKDKIVNLEEAMKRTRVTSNPPSRDDASHVLDDLYMIEDALQNQLYHQTPQSHLPPSSGMFPAVANGPAPSPFIHTQQQQQQQQRNSMQMQQNAIAAAAYNSPMFNPNYYYTQQYMMNSQGAAPVSAPGLLGSRNPLPLPYMDGSGMNFTMPQSTPLLPAPTQDGRPSNLYSLLTQPQQPMSMSQLVQPITSVASNAGPPVGGTVTVPIAQPPVPPVAAATVSVPVPTSSVQFNKTLNNQPVEKGPPANVVITTSDPLPNPNSMTLQSQQPTLSVTIPPHHIKPSLIQTPDTTVQQAPSSAVGSVVNTNGGGGFIGFGLGGGTTVTSTVTPFTGFGTNLGTPASSSTSIFSGSSGGNKGLSIQPATSISSTTFSFKPQIEQAQSLAAAANASDTALNKTSESVSSDFNRSGTELEVEYDPRPDFKPIIPLPDEIEVRTGEEDEEVMFCCRAKLFRFVDKDWKERGIGDIKILKNKEGYSRILMRRDQTHKICANHKITKELILSTPKNEKKGLIWVANDFADEELKVERFFVRFKLPESAQQFLDAFKKAQKEAEKLDAKKGDTTESVGTIVTPAAAINSNAEVKEKKDKEQKPPFGLAKSSVANFATSTPASKGTPAVSAPTTASTIPPIATAISSSGTTVTTSTTSKALFGGFSITKSTETPPMNKAVEPPKSTASPFANFSFDKSSSMAVTSTPAPNAVATSTASPFTNIFSNLSKTTTASQSPFSSLNLPAFQSPFATSSAATATTTNTAGLATTPTSTLTSVDATTSAQNKSNVSDVEDEYVPTATFNPVIPLPDLVEVTTGEENEIVLFEHRAKLLRFDKEAGEWKERGLGNIKLLQDKEDMNKVRLLMRREQVHKLCCNQRLYKDTKFKYVKNSQTALSWAGQDFSENELVTEMLTVRFKTPEVCKQFHEAVLKAQANMSAAAEEGNVKAQEAADKQTEKELEKVKGGEAAKDKGKETEKAVKEAPKGFGDAFKPKAGSWSCTACYISNTADNLYCIACDSPKDATVPKKETADSLLTNAPKTPFTFGFAPAGATGSTAATTAAKPTFTFGMPSTTVATTPTVATANTPVHGPVASKPSGTGFGDQFKPKAGSWTCQACYLSNTAEAIYCKACDAPKDDTVPKKDPTSGVLSLSNSSQKFSFGFAAAGANANGTTKPMPTPTGFTFGTPITTQSDPSKPVFGGLANAAAADAAKSFTFTPPTGSTTTALSKPTFSFTLQSKTMEAPAMPTASSNGGGAGGEAAASPFSLDKKDFNFTLKPKSPGKASKSPLKFGGGGGDADGAADEGDDGDYHEEEEENNTYFTPVIPLPDKIDVKTGEENEEILYAHRAKLYRFVDGEWKERGVGDVKILRHKETKKLRVVMRRDQVLKICLNHVLNEDVEYKYKDDKSWLFVVNDFSEGAVELEKFSLRFKTKEIALGFMEAVKDALAGTAVPIENVGGNTSASNSTLSTLSKAPETQIVLSDIDKQTANKLQLPYEFFTAKPACLGCRGCDPDNFVFRTLKPEESYVDEEESKNPLGPLTLPALKLPHIGSSSANETSTPKVGSTNVTNALGTATPTTTATPVTGLSNASRSILKQSALAPAMATTVSSTPPTSESQPSAGKASETNIFSGFGGANSTSFGSSNTGEKTASAFSFTAALNSSNKPDETKTGSSGGFVFGSSGGVSGGSLFGGVGGDKKSVFGQVPSIFGNASMAIKPADTNANVESPKSIFGGNTTSTSSGTIFGGKPIFGGGSTSIFDGKANESGNETNKSIFSGLSNVTPNAGSGTGSSIFGSTFAGFGNTSATQPSIFGGANNNTSSPFSNTGKDQTSTAAPSFADLSSKAGGVDFASLAAKASATPPTKAAEKPAAGGFIGLTDQDAFSSFRKPNNSLNASKKDDNANESAKSVEEDENYDPHYEPIIALPNEIVVSTGEEEETKLFGERATLYRWDANTKEWKERGVGELKILLHPAKQTYRMVMRREQIHKLVLNHAVGADFSFSNMNNSPKSFIWATMNYAESTEGELEKLAVRFKNVDLAEQFRKKLKECIEAAKQRADEPQD